MAQTTDARLFSLRTALADDTLLVARFRGEEALSRLYRFELELASDRPDIDALELIGKPAHLLCERDGTHEDGLEDRVWSGFVCAFSRTGQTSLQHESENTQTFYRMEIVPWLWFMQHHEDSRIFQNLAVPDIVEKLFEEFGYADYELKLNASYAPLVHCTQYRESVFQFISRLLEQAGIHWFFRHDEQGVMLVLTDHAGSHPPLGAEDDALRFHEQDMSAGIDTVTGLARAQELRTGRIALNDYNFERPGIDLQVGLDSVVHAGDNADYERYIHPGGYEDRDGGDQIARLLIEAEEARHETLHGQSHARRMGAGLTFTLEDHPQDALNQRYLITGVTHEGSNNLGGAAGGEAGDYRNDFAVLPLRVPYRAPLATPRPRIAGPQTAVVAGPDGEEIYTDPYGRVKLHFFWDRRSRRNDKSSCWVRVAQMWAGRQWGAMCIPRIGQEVVVEFLEGDPDRPLVTGTLYNGDNLPPYALPGHATVTTLKSQSSKGGKGFNELRFEDKADAEQVFLHAQKDLDLRVLNDARSWVGQDAHRIVQRDAVSEIHRDQSGYIKRDRITEVGRDDALTVHGKQAIAVGGSRSLKVDGAVGDAFASHSESVQSDYYLNAGTNVVIEAGAMITLKVAGSSITLSAAGVTIDGPLVGINSGGAPGAGMAASLVPPAGVLTASVADLAEPGQIGRDPGAAHSPLARMRGARPPERATSHDPGSAANKDKPHTIEILLNDEKGDPVAGEPVRIELPDGSISNGSTDEQGLLKVTGIDAGNCTIRFPNLDDNAWEEA
ncbi:type VI secretion system tip protein VgrG [Corticibacter populi]|uniref:Type VI secretion system tip protein VgrG n=1 Tax=Corticibacter populi TaxID=1550736 RepID=A0A3M6QND2_9BURK|nr:type VI secretion system tip protein TssI/VgrG [Corticibacter populi]RMX04251.1 type VI secretion system tip protein VgrG [Corticibacter populi]RZS33293.1 type VI secretion system secreted protein VgrG [Corticibacter populi]